MRDLNDFASASVDQSRKANPCFIIVAVSVLQIKGGEGI